MKDESCICTGLRRAARATTAFYDEALAPSGLRITQFAILRRLARLGPSSITLLANELALDRSTAGRNLDLLRRKGLVSAGPGPDARETVMDLTERGRDAIAAALPHWRSAQARAEALIRHDALGGLAGLARIDDANAAGTGTGEHPR
jgi:DNA-binding MarR family transcriptional regulator